MLIEGSNVSLRHLGFVAGFYDSRAISALIDVLLLKTNPHEPTHGNDPEAISCSKLNMDGILSHSTVQ